MSKPLSAVRLSLCPAGRLARDLALVSLAVMQCPLLAQDLSREQIAEQLTAIRGLQGNESAQKAAALRSAPPAPTLDQRRVTALMIAFALEQAGDQKAAAAAYRSAGNEARGTPYAVSAVYRLRLTELASPGRKDLEKFYEAVAKETETQGWFLVGHRWAWSTTRRAAWQSLVDLRSDQLSFRLFAFLCSQSIFPPEYGYLFAFLVLAIGVKILELPLLVRTAKSAGQMQLLLPEIEEIKGIYQNDPLAMNQAMMRLYQRKGVSLMGGCAIAVVDPIFVIWAFIASADFAPQLALDGARFQWIPNVLERDWKLLVCWAGLGLLAILTNPVKQPGQTPLILGGYVVVTGLWMAVAWYWRWPAYVFLFWSLLSVLGLIIQLLLTPVRWAASRGH